MNREERMEGRGPEPSRWSRGGEPGGRLGDAGYGQGSGGSQQGGYGSGRHGSPYGYGSMSAFHGGPGGYGYGYGSGGYGSQGAGGQGYAGYGGAGYGWSYGSDPGVYGGEGYGRARGGDGPQGYGGEGHQARGVQGHVALGGPSWGGLGGAGGWGAPASRREQRSRRGPRGYQRSDERIRDEIYDRLMQQTDIDVSDVECTVGDGVAVIAGTVERRWEKHRVEDVVDSVWGVKDIRNTLRVRGGAGEEGRGEPGVERGAGPDR